MDPIKLPINEISSMLKEAYFVKSTMSPYLKSIELLNSFESHFKKHDFSNLLATSVYMKNVDFINRKIANTQLLGFDTNRKISTANFESFQNAVFRVIDRQQSLSSAFSKFDAFYTFQIQRDSLESNVQAFSKAYATIALQLANDDRHEDRNILEEVADKVASAAEKISSKSFETVDFERLWTEIAAYLKSFSRSDYIAILAIIIPSLLTVMQMVATQPQQTIIKRVLVLSIVPSTH